MIHTDWAICVGPYGLVLQIDNPYRLYDKKKKGRSEEVKKTKIFFFKYIGCKKDLNGVRKITLEDEIDLGVHLCHPWMH